MDTGTGHRVAPTTAYRDQVVATVTARVRSRLDALAAAGVPLESLGSPDQVADQVAAALPTSRHPYDLELGPFYDTGGLTRWLGVTRQALADRVRRGACSPAVRRTATSSTRRSSSTGPAPSGAGSGRSSRSSPGTTDGWSAPGS